MAKNDKTEKATPKKRDDARRKGQVARSHDLNGAVILMAAIMVLPAAGPLVWNQSATSMRRALSLLADPGVVTRKGVGPLLQEIMLPAGLAILPIAGVCAIAAVAVNVLQVGFKPTPGVMKPDFKKLNPIAGLKNLFGPKSAFETGKNVLKVAVVAAIAAVMVLPRLQEIGDLVGMPAAALAPALAHEVMRIVQYAAAAYLVLAVIDYFHKRHEHEKSLRMDLQEVKDEYKQQASPQEVRQALRRRAREAAGRRMMDAVPTADVVVTNPTHYAVALRYDAAKGAPEVVAKGMDNVAFRIRDAAREAGVPVVPNPPLARSLHASVEVGHLIPEELYQAVAQLLAFVYRTARRAAA